MSMAKKVRTTVSVDPVVKEKTEEILRDHYNDRSLSEHVGLLLRVFIREYQDADAYRDDAEEIQTNLAPFVSAFEEMTTAVYFDMNEYDEVNTQGDDSSKA